MIRLTLDQVKRMHHLLIEETGGLHGVRDEGLLESAVLSPFHTFDGELLYKTIELRAARLCYSLIRNHPFNDGNKRVGILAMLAYLQLNFIELRYTNDDLVSIGLQIATGEMDANQLARWIIASQHDPPTPNDVI